MVIIGIVFAALGVVSCIVPGMLAGMIQILLGLLNITGGAALLIKRFLPILHEIRTPPAVPVIVPSILKKLMVTQTALSLVTIAFGISMIIPGLVSGLIIAGILIINGLLLFILASFLQKVTGMQSSGEQPSIKCRRPVNQVVPDNQRLPGIGPCICIESIPVYGRITPASTMHIFTPAPNKDLLALPASRDTQ
jgi:hypothetical protein